MAPPDPLSAQFVRWRAHGDSAALAAVFDACAPRLLALAVHLAGNMSQAEDLLQATFLTALERAEGFDATRPLEPWLVGILANHARDLQRLRARETGPRKDPAPLARTPLDEALDSESAQVVGEALDRLEEPYRSVLVLASRQGMSPAEIAYALNRSPGAVRVQLHRGREMLRRFLPAGWIASAGSARGLAELRGVVLARARLLRPLAVSGSIAGGILVGKKLVLALFVLAFCLVVGIVGARLARTAGKPLAPAPESHAVVETEAPSLAPDTARPSERAGLLAPASDAPRAVHLRCRVIDGDTGAGIAGAEVSLFAVREMSAAELRRRWGERLNVERRGYLQGRPWPRVVSRAPRDRGQALTEEELFGVEALRVHAPPEPGAQPIARSRSDAQGWFDMQAPAELGFLICAASGYAPRNRALDPAELDAAGKSELALTLTLQRTRVVHGRLVTPEGKPIERSLRLSFFGHLSRTATYTPSRDGPIAQRDKELDRQCDTWSVASGPDGRFECELSAVSVRADSLDPEWTVARQLVRKTAGGEPRHCAWFDTNEAQAELLLVLVPATALSVRDAVTHVPIEELEIECVQADNGRVLMRGPFFAREGRLRLSAPDSNKDGERENEEDRAACLLTVWARGHQASTLRLADLVTPGLVSVELQPGEAAGIDVQVLEDGRPAVEARAGIVPVREPLWSPRLRGAADLERADATGRVRLEAPPGQYALFCCAGERALWRLVELPCPEVLRVDLSSAASLRVELRSADGVVQPDMSVELQGRDGLRASQKSDGQGHARFAGLAAGSYTLRAADAPDAPAEIGSRRAEVDLAAGQALELELAARPGKQRFARLVLPGARAPRGWKACDLHGGYLRDLGACAIEVRPDGRIPIELIGETWLSLVSPERATWSCHVPADAPDGFAIEIDPDGPGYRGTLSSASDGSPLRGVRVFAKPAAPGRGHERTRITLTDGEGRFELRGLDAVAYYLQFEGAGNSINAYDMIYAYPHALPGTQGEPLEIALPLRSPAGIRGLESLVDVRGRVHSASGDVRQLHGAVGAVLAGSSCDLQVWCEVRLQSDGRYEARLPAAPEYRASFVRAGEEQPVELRWSASVADGVVEHDIELP